MSLTHHSLFTPSAVPKEAPKKKKKQYRARKPKDMPRRPLRYEFDSKFHHMSTSLISHTLFIPQRLQHLL